DQQVLTTLSTDQALQQMLTQLRRENSQLAEVREQDVQNLVFNNSAQMAQEDGGPNNGLRSENGLRQMPNNRYNAAAPRGDRDPDLRKPARAQAARLPNLDQSNTAFMDNRILGDNGAKGQQAPVVLGPLIPLWLKGSTGERLVLARLVQIGPRLACHVA